MFTDPKGVRTPLSHILDQQPPQIPVDWGQGRTAFGGLSSMLATRAMEAAATPDDGSERPLQSIAVHFVGPVAVGPVEVQAEVLRAGRYMTQTTACLLSGGKVALTAHGAHGTPRPSQLELDPPAAPDLPAPESLPEMPYIPGMMPAFTQHIEYRWATPHFPFTGGDSPIIRGWCRARADHPVDAGLVLLLIDSWPAGVLTMAPTFTAASSVLWMVTFFDTTPLPAHSWLKTEQRTTMSRSGHAENVADVWSADGRLIARSRQLVTVYG